MKKILTDAAAVGNATGRLLNWRSLVPHPEWAKARAVGLGVGNRRSGWNAWVTFSISPMAPTSTVTPTRRIATK